MQYRRKSIRLPGYDYSQPGMYFITICTDNHQCFFGEIDIDRIAYTEIGKMAGHFWLEIPNHFKHVVNDEFIVMPDHLHGLLIIDDNFDGRGTACRAPTTMVGLKQKPLGRLIGAFKTVSTKHINHNNCPIQWYKSPTHFLRPNRFFCKCDTCIIEIRIFFFILAINTDLPCIFSPINC